MLFQRELRLGAQRLLGGNLSKMARRMAFGAATLAVCAPAWAGPEGERVVAGNATFRRSGPLTSITASNGAVINYHSFNIGPMETVRFIQPSSTSRVLNRIDGPDPTSISGQIIANGIVYIMNPAGVYFRQGAVVNVGTIYAGAAHLSDADFAAGRDRFTGVRGEVVNDGVINAKAAHLIGRVVSNPGVINASGGVVTMTSGDEVLIGEAGGNVFVRVTDHPAQPLGGAGGGAGTDANATGPSQAGPSQAGPTQGGGRFSPDRAAVSNTGRINAEGGRVALTAGDVYGMAIFGGGRITARNVRVEGQGRGVVQASGAIDASSVSGRGGDITITGEHVRVQGANLDASGAGAGGTVHVGGEFQGGGATRTAETTFVDGASVLRADGRGDGARGGEVVVWSEGLTGFYGEGSVQGGRGGVGGLIETSGKEALDVRGAVVRAGAVGGAAGSWLLDPSDITIRDSASSNASVNSTTGAFTLTGDSAIVNAADITSALTAGANVTINTNNAGGTQQGNITVGDTANGIAATINPVIGAGVNVTLTLQAANSITLSSNASITPTGAGTMGLVLSAQDPAGGSVGSSGVVTISTPLSLGSLSVSGRTISLGGGTITTSGNQSYIYTVPSSTQGLTLNAATTLTSTAGNIILGQSGNIGTIRGANSLALSAPAGAITFNTTFGAGSSTPTSLSVTAASVSITGGFVRTSGAQTWNAPVAVNTAGNSFNFTGTDLTFSSTLRSAVNNEESLTVNATGTQTYNGAVGGGSGDFNSLILSGAGGGIAINGGVVRSSGNQIFINSVTLGADTAFTSATGSVQFLGNIDGSVAGQQSLTVNGNAVISGIGGGGAALEFVTVTGTTQIEDAVVTSAGPQTYGGAVTIAGSDGSNRTLQGTTITFNGPVNALTAGSQGLDIVGDAVFNAALGASVALASLSVSGTTALNNSAGVTTSVVLGSGDQTYTGGVTLGTANGSTVTLATGGGLATFASGLNATAAGQQGLTITGNASFGGAVGAGQALSAVSVSGTSRLGGSVATTGTQTYTGDTALNGANGSTTTLTGSSVTFSGALDATATGQQGLSVVGNAAFNGVVGTTALRSLAVSGTTSIGTTSVTTTNTAGGTGNQTFTGVVTLNTALGSTDTFTSTGGTVNFAGGVNASAAGRQRLSVVGDAAFGGNTTTALGSLSVTGATAINGVTLSTTTSAGGTGNQTFTGAVTLGGADDSTSTLTTSGGAISFASTINATTAGEQGLTITGPASFSGAVGGGAALRQLQISGATTFATGGSAVTTSSAGGGSGNQTYTGAVTLNNGAATVTTLTSTGGTVSFSAAIDGAGAGEQGLSIVGDAGFGSSQAIGGTQALRSLDVSGATSLTAASVNTTNSAGGTGAQSYTGALTLNAANGSTQTFTATGGTVSFGAVNAATAGQQGLSVTGPASFAGAVGSSAALRSLAVGGATTFAAGGTGVTTTNSAGGTGAQTYTGAVTLNSGNDTTVTLAATGGAVTFSSTIDAQTAGEQGLAVTGSAVFSGAVGGGTALRGVAVSGTSAINTASIATTSAGGGSGDQTYSGAATLGVANGSTVTLTSTGGTVGFGAGVGGAAAGQQALTVTGNASITGGTTSALRALSVSGAASLNGGTITTTNAAGGTGDQTYSGAVTLNGGDDATTTLATSGGSIAFGSTVDATTAGEQGLVVTGPASFGDAVGGGAALRSLSVSGAASLPATVTTSNTGGGTGDQTYTTGVTLTADTTLSTGTGRVTFTSTLDGTTAGQEDLTINGAATFGGAVGGVTPLGNLGVTLAARINGGAITTQGQQNFNGALTLGGNTVLDAGAGDILLGSTVDALSAGGASLTLNSTGLTTLGGVVGGTGSLSTLTTNAGGSTTLSGVTITTTGAQTFNDGVTLGTDMTLNALTVAFNSTLDGTTASQEGVTINGDPTFGGAIGGGTALEFITINGVLNLTADTSFTLDSLTLTTVRSTGGPFNLTLTCATLAAIGDTSNADNTPAVNDFTSNGAGVTRLLGGSTVRTAGTQTYSSTGGVEIGGTAGQNATLISGGAVSFSGAIDSASGGARGLVVQTAADTTFSGAIGGVSPLSRLETSLGGTTFLGAGTVATSGSTVVFSDAVVLTADTTITDSGGGVFFESTVDSDGTNRALTVNTPGGGTIRFASDVGLGSALSTLTTTTTGGTTEFGVGDPALAVSTTGAIDLGGPVRLNADAVTFSAANNSEIRFRGTVDSFSAATRALTVNTGGLTRFDASIGSVNALTSLTTDSPGTAQFGDATGGGAPSISVSVAVDGVDIGEQLTLDADVTINSVGAGGTVRFRGAVDSLNATARDLTITNAGATQIDADVGNAFELDTLTISGAGLITIGDGSASRSISTNGAQSYQSGLTLNTGAASSVTFTAGTGGVSFAAVDGATAGEQTLAVTGAATFSGAAGGANALASVSVSGATTFAGGSVTTTNAAGGTGDQAYSGAVTLAGGAGVLTTVTTTGGQISFGSTVDATTAGQQGLSVAGPATFFGDIGAGAALRSLSVTGAATIGGVAVNTTSSAGGTGDQTFAAVTLNSANDTIVAFNAGGGAVSFSTLDAGAAGEQGASITGNATFSGAIGATTPLASLAVSGTTSLAGSAVNTTNAGGGTGAQSYTGAVTLDSGDDSTVTFTSTGASVTFTGGLTGATAGEQTAVVTGDAVFGGSTTTALGGLSVSGATSMTGVTLRATNAGGGTGAITFTGPLTLTGNTGSTAAVNSTGGVITFTSSIDAQADLGQSLSVTADGGGSTVLGGVVGGANALASLSVTGPSAINTTAISTSNAGGGSGNQTFTGAASLGTGDDSTITFTATGGRVSFTSALEGQAAGEQAIVITGDASFGGSVGATTPLASLSVSGATTLAGTTVATSSAGGGTGNQTFTGAVSLTSGTGTTVNFTSTGGVVNFGSTLDASAAGAEAVITTGNTTFGGVVGGVQALAALTVNGAANINTLAINTSSAGGGTGNQTYTGAATLGTATGSTVALTATGGVVSLNNGVSATTAGEQSLTITGGAAFGGGTGTALGALSVSGASQIGAVTLTTTNAAGASGNQTFTGAVTLNGANDTTATFTTTGGRIAFGSTVNATAAGEQGLAINGDATLGGSVGATTALRLITVSGASTLAGDLFRTSNAGGGSGVQTYTGVATLGGDTGSTKTFTATGGSVTFGATLDASAAGAQTVTVNGPAVLTGAVGGTNRLFRLNLNGAASVGNDVSTTTGQSYAGDVTLARGAADNQGVSTFDGGAGPISFQGNVNATASGQQGMIVRTTGLTRFSNGVASPNPFPTGDGQIGGFRSYQPPIGFGGSIGATQPLRSLTLDTQRNGVVPTVSTIVFAPGITAENGIPDSISGATLDATTFTIRATDTVTIGYLDKVLSFGSLSILGAAGNTLNSARIGDMTSLRGLDITADQIAIRRRAGSNILGQSDGAPSNTVINTDLGVDLLGSSITFSVEPFVHDGDISNPTQIPGDAVRTGRILTISTPDGTGVNIPNYSTIQAFGSGDLLTQFADRGPAPTPSFFLPFDLRSQGPVNTSISSTIAALVVVEPPDIQTETGVGAALREELREIGVLTRDLLPDEIVEFLLGRSLYDDRSATGALGAASQRGIAVGRLAADVVKKVLTQFKEVKQDQDLYRDAIAEALSAFLDTDAGKADQFDAQAFHDFVMARATDDAARTALVKLDLLFQDLDQLGLGPVELVVCKRKIVGFVRPSEMTDDDLVKTVEARQLTAAR